MEIGVNGRVSLQITDHISNEVVTVECSNLITNYGLQRLFAPTNLKEKTATHLCLGYRTTDPTYTDNSIPADYIFVEATGTPSYVSEDVVTCTWRHNQAGLANIPVGTKFNHMYLAYKDADGIFWPITSLMFKNTDGELFEYEHSANTSINATYLISLNISGRTLSTTDYKAVLFSEYQTETEGVYLHDLKEPLAYYENDPDTREEAPALIKAGTGVVAEDGTFKQKYTIKVKSYSWAGAFVFRIGFAYWRFNPTNYRVAGSYELELTIKQPPIEAADPRPATSIVISPSGGGYETDRRRVKISAPPYQWVDLFYNNLYLGSDYVGPSGFFYRSSYIENAYDENNEQVYVGQWLMSMGNRIKVVTRTAKGYLETMLPTPDLQADDLIAIWWLNPTTIRAVSRINDTISIQWTDDIYKDGRSSRGNFIETGNSGKCTTLFDEANDYFYCDIEMVGYSELDKPFIGYKVTDAAGNVYDGTYSDAVYYAANYLEGATYEKALAAKEYQRGGLAGQIPQEYNDEVNKYHYSFRVLSAEIK